MDRPVVVVGSLNLDLVVTPARAPAAGETVFAPRLDQFPGGKGGNQAVAAARLSTPVAMVGRVGQDAFGDRLLESLRADGVATEAVSRSATAGTGTAVITVDATGQNRIVVVPGANAEVTPEVVEACRPLIASASVLLLQLEVPVEACLRAAELAAAAGVPVILDPAPAPGEPLPRRLRECTWLVTPNESEAATLTGIPVEGRRGAEEAARALAAQGFRQVLIKCGGEGACLYREGACAWFDAFTVPVVDTTAAGDAFAGGLAAALQRGMALDEAVRWGMAAGALAVTRAGAQPAMGTLGELMALLERGRQQA
ncbi:ribokinase [Symbiobacterium terraclitae]|uniref:ribokinase n=1 Tax=Symbiobacterium terraclitae TaxID=557451 RepID=UPI0035B52229